MARYLHDGPSDQRSAPVRRQGDMPSGMGGYNPAAPGAVSAAQGAQGMGYNAAIGMGGPLTANPFARSGMGGYSAAVPGAISAARGTQGMGQFRRLGDLPSGMGGYTNQDTTALQTKLQPLMTAAAGQAAQLGQGVQVAGTSYPQGDQNVLAGISQQVQSFQNDVQAAGAVPFTMFSAQTGGFAAGDAYYKATLIPLQTQVQGFASRGSGIQSALNAWVNSAKAVAANAATAAANATAQNQADNQTVTNARSQAQSLASGGNFPGALAALQAQAVVSAASRLGIDLSGDVNAITTAQTNANRTSQQAADLATVNRAKTQATSLSGQGLYDAALAALQAQNVTDAATRINYDLNPDIAAVSGAKAQAQKQADAANLLLTQQNTANTAQQTTQQAMIACAQNGGQWNGFYCDMTQANRASAVQAACVAKGGTWDPIANSCDMTAANSAKVDAAIASANAQAAIGTAAGFSAALGILAGAANAAAASNRQADIATAQAGIQDQKSQALCASQGGTWDPVAGACSGAMTPAQQAAAAQTANQPPAWITQLLPSLLAPTPAPAPVYAPAPPGYAPAPAPAAGGMSAGQQTILALLESFGGPQGAAFSSAIQGSLGTPTGVSPGAPDGTPCSMPDGSPGSSLGGICASSGSLGIGTAPASGVTETF